MKINEGQLMNQMIRYLCSKGLKVFRANVARLKLSDGRYFTTGLPNGFSDIFGVWKDGKAIFVEVKLPKGKATKEQVDFINEMRFRGCFAGIATNLDEVDDILAGGIGNKEKMEKYQGYTKAAKLSAEDEKFWDDLMKD